MKRFLILLVLFALLLTGCVSEEYAQISRANSSVTKDSFDLVVTEHYDGGQDLIQRIEYNKNTKITIIYNYYWSNSGWGKTCTGSSITTIDADGNIIVSPSDQAG